MTVGMPGTGIGGLFYLASALWMPLREGLRAVGRRARPRPRRLRLALRQGAIGVGALAAIWTAGWLVGVLIRVSAASGVAAAGPRSDALSHAVPASAALLTIGTLAGVLLGVELLRLLMDRRATRPANRHAAVARAWGQLSDSGRQRAAAAAARRWTELTDSGRKRVAAAAAWAELSESGRKWVAAAAPWTVLTRSARHRAGPAAPWMAATPSRRDGAGNAARLTLLVLGLTLLPAGVARGQAAPAIEPLVSGSHDSDGNRVWRFAAAADVRVAGATRLGIALRHTDVSDGFAQTSLDELSLRVSRRPRTGVRVEATAGVLRPHAGAGTESNAIVPTASIRARWRPSGGATALDVRGRHDVLDASPTLVVNRVRRSEARVMAQVPLFRRLRLRALGAAAELRTETEVNHRTAGSGIVAFAVTPLFEVSGQFHQAGYAEPSTAGYFAPRLSQTMEVGSYLEVETTRLIVALDLGVGVQRLAEHGGGVGSWERALRLYSLTMVPLAPGRQLALEIEAYDGLIGTESAGGAGWRQLSGALSLRWALR